MTIGKAEKVLHEIERIGFAFFGNIFLLGILLIPVEPGFIAFEQFRKARGDGPPEFFRFVEVFGCEQETKFIVERFAGGFRCWAHICVLRG